MAFCMINAAEYKNTTSVNGTLLGSACFEDDSNVSHRYWRTNSDSGYCQREEVSGFLRGACKMLEWSPS